jgi:hypothetical protein
MVVCACNKLFQIKNTRTKGSKKEKMKPFMLFLGEQD